MNQKKSEPWTHEELARMRRHVRGRLDFVEASYPDARPLPPMAEDETRELIDGMLDTAAERALTKEECFLFGQLVAQFQMAVEARMLGKPGRYYVISDDRVERISIEARAPRNTSGKPQGGER